MGNLTVTVSVKNLVGGEWRDSSTAETSEDLNPADIRDVVALFPESTREDARAAIDAGSDAQESWGNLAPPRRAKILFRAAEILEAKKEDLARAFTREEGKTIHESRAELARAVDIFRFFAGEGDRLSGEVIPSDDPDLLLYTQLQPLGVVSIITPWNFPVAIPAWKIAPALVCGNAVVFKPASQTPLIGMKLVEALKLAGLPDGVLNFVTGPGSTVGMELIENEKVNAISFTGSFEVGQKISKSCVRTNGVPRLQLEMGGKNPLVILADADLPRAVEITIKGAFGGTGQACTATSRVIVEDSMLEKYSQILVERVRQIKVGNGLDESTEMGPTVSEQELEKDLNYVEIGKREGARLICGGKRPTDAAYAHGFFMQPTVFTDVARTMRIWREEIFGPVVAIHRTTSLEQAIELANDAEYGLCAAICTQSLEKAHAFIRRVQAGVVKVNRPTTGLMVQAPFGGMKKSSSMTFKEQGRAAVDFYTFTKSVYVGARP